MKAKTVLFKRSTLVSGVMVGIIIAFCSATQEQVDPIKERGKGIGLKSVAVVAR